MNISRTLFRLILLLACAIVFAVVVSIAMSPPDQSPPRASYLP